jgi:hypothetical protein
MNDDDNDAEAFIPVSKIFKLFTKKLQRNCKRYFTLTSGLNTKERFVWSYVIEV